jgi:hypothetical protein
MCRPGADRALSSRSSVRSQGLLQHRIGCADGNTHRR